MKTKECFSKKTILITFTFCQILFIIYFHETSIPTQAQHSAKVRKNEMIAAKPEEADESMQHHAKVNSPFTIIPEIPNNTSLLIVINTIPSKFERRQTLRETWAKRISVTISSNSPRFKPLERMRIAYFFSVGFDGHSSIDTDTQREADVQQDILRLDLKETYRGVLQKVLLTFEWVANLNIKPRFIVKADDDVYIKVPDLARWLLGNGVQQVKRLYAGFVHRSARVVRSPKSRWYVSSEQYKNDYFPAYCKGGFYVLSRNVLLEIVNASKVTELFPVEDASIGVLVSKIGVIPMRTRRKLVILNKRGVNERVLAGKQEIFKSVIAFGHSLSSKAIRKLHCEYWKQLNQHNSVSNIKNNKKQTKEQKRRIISWSFLNETNLETGKN